MSLPDLKKLKQLVAFCRKAGVESIECEGFKITLADQPVIVRNSRSSRNKSQQLGAPEELPMADDQEEVENDMLSPEDLLYYSSAAPTDAINAENQ